MSADMDIAMGEASSSAIPTPLETPGDKWVISYRSYGFEHGIVQRPQKLVIRTQPITSTHITTWLKEDGNENISRPTILPTQQELEATTGVGMVVVGLCLTERLGAGKKGKVGKKASKKAIEEGPEQEVDVSGCKTPFLRVAVQKGNPILKYYALAQPDQSGLCKPRHVEADDCFFFAEFCTNATSIEGRRNAWSAEIRKVSIDADASTASRLGILNAQATQYSSVMDKSKVIDVPALSYINELRLLVASYSMTKSLETLQRLRSLLNDDMTKMQLQTEIGAFRAFFNIEGEFTKAQAEMLAAAKAFWGGWEMDGDVLFDLRGAMKFLGVEGIESWHGKQFIMYMHDRIARNDPQWTTDQSALLKHAHAYAIASSTESRPTISSDQFQQITHALTRKLHDWRMAMRDQLDELRDYKGPQVTTETLPQLMEAVVQSTEYSDIKLTHQLMGRAGQAEMADWVELSALGGVDAIIQSLTALQISKTD